MAKAINPEDCLHGDNVDFNTLREMSRRKGGFGSNTVRRRVWPVLLGIGEKDISHKFRSFVDKEHRDVQQIQNDIERSLWKQDCVQEWSKERRRKERRRLEDIINAVLSRNEGLHYYQGFHDICSVFYLVLENDALTFSCIEALAADFIRDDMRENFDGVLEIMKLVFVVIAEVDEELYKYLTAAKAEPFFTISWVLTWFAHEISDIEDIARLYDAILCSHPSYIIYLCSSFAMSNRYELMKEDRDFGSVQNFFVKAPVSIGIPLEDIIEDADTIYSLFPDEDLVRHASAHLQKMLNMERITIFRDVPKSVYAADGEIDAAKCDDFKKKHGSSQRKHDSLIAKKPSAIRKSVTDWRSSDLKILSRNKQHSFLKPSKFSLFIYKKMGRRLYPFASRVVPFISSINPFAPGFWPALIFNQLLFADGKDMLVSIVSVAIIGGFLGFGLGGYLNN